MNASLFETPPSNKRPLPSPQEEFSSEKCNIYLSLF